MSEHVEVCPKCNGAKVVTCPHCEGEGGWEHIIGGETTWETCHICWGKRVVDCPECGGTGRITVPD
jgi:DnaJ-class molecular chaperone